MERRSDGAIILTPGEARTARAGLFACLHFAQSDWAASELKTVTGHSRAEIVELMRRLDMAREPESIEDGREALRFHLDQLGGMTDSELTTGRTGWRLQGVVREALAAGVDVPARLLALAEDRR